MSISLMAEAWRMTIPTTEKMVLLCLCDFANDRGECWPSVDTLAGKCSLSDRTVQKAIKQLREWGIISTVDVPGRSHTFTVNPRSSFTPENASPPKMSARPPKQLHPTPEAASPKPSRNHQEPSKEREAREHCLPDGWTPRPLTPGTKSFAMMAEWPPGEDDVQLEHFTAHHRKKGDKFKDWQAAWVTWVLNGRKFGNGKRQHSPSAHRPLADIARSVAADLEREASLNH